ncbi:uncharacterized protein PGTG_19441 [Puccinia graminis f. sp. tritici CRL 75-36-700-3]|uniref:Uncharacterized protein n=1 Tax=Puccinia graminis f. sp. tritici (strain CRL 75-36-700-3 / race SCCL) TaxID=418459 RepID=E3L9H7_PUCGT|nr:uncharacterized protein PGTG_19441 [Puccinia graminis f. sp. tritici CRL 75-36-700-3]EFP93202.2 hypothetical protein PGTG_19441 [Puccinia graminis f. sp. tritici CRL 75-36-700-3]
MRKSPWHSRSSISSSGKLKSTKRNHLQGNQAANPNPSILPPENLRQISQAIWAHWNAPSPTISYKIKNALKNLFEYMNHSRINLPQSSSVQFFLESVKQSILLEKRSLSILSYLLPHLSLEDALQAFQLFAAGPAEFLGTILGSIGDDKLASVIGQLAVHWTTKVEGWDSKDSKTTADSANLSSDWISTVFSILFSSEERKRQYLCQYYLLPLFKTRPVCFMELAERLSLISGPRFQKISIAKNAFDHLSGIIALARLNPRQSGPHQKDRNHVDPWLPDDLLKVALSHPSVSLRSSALAIICQSTAPTSPLPLPHLDLIFQFFVWNFGEVEAELKQNIFSNLNALFNRLRDSSTSSNKKLGELINKKSNLNQSNNHVGAIETTTAVNGLEATQLQILIVEAEGYLQAVKTFIEKFMRLCRSNLTISSPYRCQMASLTYLQILLNTGLDPRYQPLTKSSLPSLHHNDQASLLKKPSSSFPFEIRVVDRALFHKLILSLTSTYVDVREAAFTLLEKTGCSALDSPAEQGSQSVIRFMPFAVQCCNSSREAENSTAALLFRLVLKSSLIHNFELPSFLLPRNNNHSETTNPLAIFLVGRLDDLEDRVLQSELNLGKACEERPMAGSIMLMSELFKCLSKDMIGSLVASNDLIVIMNRTRKLILRVWSSSAIVLCQSSDRQSDVVPDHEEARAFEFISTEEDGDELEDDADRNPGNRHKTILSACWRSMKEASALLMQTVKLSLIAEEQSAGDNRNTFLSYQDLTEIGELFEQWLLEIRHRGAFGAIHASYSGLCDALCALPKESASSQLPVLWLQAHISAITSRKISTTRRSAGMPYCILSACQALSRSNPNQLRESLSTILSLAESQEISSEVQVHILNTLKILLTDGKVSAQFSSVLIERSYNLAIKTFVSPDWRVRNGALILFSGLTNRVFGTRSLTLDRSYSNLCKRESLSDFSRRLPTMPSILLQELRRSMEAGIHLVSTSHSHGPMFAVLTLLALLQNPDDALTATEFIPLVRACLLSKVSKVRSIGADAMTGLVPCSQVPGLICDLLDQAVKSHCHNEVHGLLLLINRLIQLPSALLRDQKSNIEVALARSAPKFLHSMTIPLVSQSTFLEILESLESRFMIKVDDHDCLFSPGMMTDKIQELRRIRAPALSSFETQATRNVLGRNQARETVLKLLEVGSTSTRVTVFRFLEKEENRETLKDPEIIDAVFRIGRQSTHPISVRLPALKLLTTIGSGLKTTLWPVEELFNECNSTLAIPMRDALLVLSACFFVNSLVDRNSKIDSSFVRAWADKILNKIQQAAHEDQSTETRLSAVQGLTEFMKVFKRNGVLSTSVKLRILELLISLIQDDDDEIRSSLIKSLHQTKFFSSLVDSQPNQEDQHCFQLELVPNLILEKLLHLAIGLNAFFGFKTLLNRDNFQADLDQLLQPPDDLFITERLNLYKDDLMEFELIQTITSKRLIQLDKLDDDDQQQPNERLGTQLNCKKIDADFQDLVDLNPELRTFKYLLSFLVPKSIKTLKGFEIFGDDLFINHLNRNPGPNADDHDAHFNVISFKAWFSILLRLFNSITIFNRFPPNIQSSILASISDLPPSFPVPQGHLPHQDPVLDALALEIDHQFTLIQNFLTAFY